MPRGPKPNNALEFSTIKNEMRKLFKARVLDAAWRKIGTYDFHIDFPLWGEEKGRHFEVQTFYLTLYKDVHDCGYSKLGGLTRHFYNANHKSLEHNIIVMRQALVKWSTNKQIVLGNLSDWTKEARNLKAPKGFEKVVLWWDSTDCPRYKAKGEGAKTNGEKHGWSHKEVAISLRFMTLTSAKRRIRMIWGPYSPKAFDGRFLEAKREWIETNLAGATNIADGHFSIGRTLFRSVPFLVNYPVPNIDDADDTTQDIPQLTKERLDFNARHSRTRARIESVFGEIKKKFKTLSTKTQIPIDDQANVFKYACGLHNCGIN